MKLRSYSKSSGFQRKFHQYCVECEDGESVYDGFVELCKGLAAENAKTAEGKLNVYSWYMGRRHWPRAKWVYLNLFRQYRSILAGDIDLVFWGCGCGLDLLAIYDEAIGSDIPNFWAVVRTVTLLDSDEVRLKRSAEIAEVLFPCARDRIKTVQCDWNNPIQIEMAQSVLRQQISSAYIPRVHILSRAIVESTNVADLAERIKRLVARVDGRGNSYFNEVFCAYAPDSNRRVVGEKMEKIRTAWADLACSPTGTGIPNSRVGTYFTFHCITYNDSPLQAAIRLDNSIFRTLLWIEVPQTERVQKMLFMQALLRLNFGGVRFSDVYRYVLPVELANTKNRGDKGPKAKCFLFAPEPGSEYKALLVKWGAYEGEENAYERYELARSWLRMLGAKTSSPEILELRDEFAVFEKGVKAGDKYKKLFAHINVLAWDTKTGSWSQPYDKGGRYTPSIRCQPFDQFSIFGVVSRADDEVLPSSLNKVQRTIAASRKRQRMVRGGPGTGKTLTMLHHALSVYQRTRLPVLLLSKTNSLQGNNYRRLRGSHFKRYGGRQLLEDWIFPTRTISMLLCELARLMTPVGELCDRRKCSACLHDCIGEGDCAAHRPNGCPDCCNIDSALAAIGERKLDANGLPFNRAAERMKVLSSSCDRCQERVRNMILQGELDIPDKDPIHTDPRLGIMLLRRWGGVMVDEAQLIDPKDLQLVHKITEHFNPWREFYMFFDEEQAIRGQSLEKDERGKLTVSKPGDHFGRPQALTGNHRVRSRNLLRVYRKLQDLMADKYDIGELGMESPSEDGIDLPKTVEKVFRIEVGGPFDSFSELESVVADFKKWCRSETVTIVSDNEALVREYSDQALAAGWRRTHLYARESEEDRRTERSMRNGFEEQEGNVQFTTIDCAQGRTFENVIFILTSDNSNMEESFTGVTRASTHLLVLDQSDDGWLYEMLKGCLS